MENKNKKYNQQEIIWEKIQVVETPQQIKRKKLINRANALGIEINSAFSNDWIQYVIHRKMKWPIKKTE